MFPEGLDRHASGSMTAPPQTAPPPAAKTAVDDGDAGVQRPTAQSDDEFDYFDPPSPQTSTSVQPVPIPPTAAVQNAVQPIHPPIAVPLLQAEPPTTSPQQQLLESMDDEFDSDWDVGEVITVWQVSSH